MEPIKLGEVFGKLAKKPDPVLTAGVGPVGTLTAEMVIGWDGQEGALSDLCRDGVNVARGLLETGAIVDTVGGPTLCFVHDGKLYKHTSRILVVKAEKEIFPALRSTVIEVSSVKIVLKQSRNGSRKYYDFEMKLVPE